MATSDSKIQNNPTLGASAGAKKAALLQAVSQLDMLILVFQDAPERVKKSGKEFRDALEEWSKNAG